MDRMMIRSNANNSLTAVAVRRFVARALAMLMLVGGMVGCGGGSENGEIPVQGKVTMDGEPLNQATIRFLPNTTSNGGMGVSKVDGTFSIAGPQGQNGVPVGTYKVTVSRRLNPDGSLPPSDEEPILSKAVEKLPPSFSDPNRTTLSVNLASDGKVELKLSKSQKR
ncbi:carboxypeptidase-like regulatory domain-containing protein [Tuwongella immobilis]|uniref:Carboxypeptidase regulatory-like domain-containing protein n=1 Tax=Tuwongella immobilis TaxID=692036 RepID=A0A6C2YYL7_9BACT|nr:carboxypeptidase-like regulatory domain-containing protein [Tuwongella immobilis]VIP05795.1 Uncharacterized protein OS=Blastopirellula marina DSM 3645 GN=DSM3645_25799 PE=4 SV=1 [Tuwongella immobilis]VTS08946.1 Uncharacterized protein OS=Blastopirellula marina DSM 3645 GN=DSM3645_25799 PE=4 SV=1 [Tuwongella immobilis]